MNNQNETIIMKASSSSLRGEKRCKTERKFQKLELSTVKNMAFDLAIIAKDIIRGYFEGDFKVAEFKELILEGLMVDMNDIDHTAETDIKVAAGKDIVVSKNIEGRVNKLCNNIKRYCNSETRNPIFPNGLEITSNGLAVFVNPDLVFETKDTIEVVKIKTGKPTLTQGGKKRDASAENSLELYFMVLFGRTLVKDGETKQVSASYYFLTKNTDSSTTQRDYDFFSRQGGNVVTLYDDGVTTGEFRDMKTELDKKFETQIEEFINGEDCSAEDCENCYYKLACNYQKAPAPYEQKTNSAKKGKITPSEAQAKIIDARQGIYRVNATAGSGKTECVTERVARMFEEGVKPSEVLLVTFTDAGAVEMKDRIVKKCNDRGLHYSYDDVKAIAMTFNSFAQTIINENFEVLGFSKKPAIANTDITRNSVVIASMLNAHIIPGMDAAYTNFELNLPNARGILPLTMKVFDIIKSNHIDTDDINAADAVIDELKDIGWWRHFNGNITAVEEMVKLYKDYDQMLYSNNLLTYSDQEPYMFKVLDLVVGYFEGLGIKHIVVDEFQDSNDIQLETIKRLASTPCFESLMVVGDDSQSIYAFRKTSQENILNFFEKIGKAGTDLYLTDNRRSTGKICQFANSINDLNSEKVDKEMNSTREEGVDVIVKGFHKKDAEYEYIANGIEEKINEGHEPEEIAFIAMNSNELTKMASELSKRNIPWVMRNPMVLMDNSRVQSAIALADAFYQPEADKCYFDYLVSLEDGNILNEDVEVVKEKVSQLKHSFMSLLDMDVEYQRSVFHNMLEEIKGNDEIYAHFLELVYDNDDISAELTYIQNFKRFGKGEKYKMQNSYQGVVLTTAHSSKGLEWPVCFVSVSSFDSQRLHTGRNRVKESDEKRRLLFVAATRARDELIVTGQYVAYRLKDDKTYNQFLRECFEVLNLEYDPIDHEAELAKALKAAEKALTKAKKSKKVSANEMTEEEKAEYNKLVAGACQSTFSDPKDFEKLLELFSA